MNQRQNIIVLRAYILGYEPEIIAHITFLPLGDVLSALDGWKWLLASQPRRVQGAAS